MLTRDKLTNEWLATVLADLGDTREKVGETLRKARVKGIRRHARFCPIARYLDRRVREHLQPAGLVDVVVVGPCVYVTIGDLADGGYQIRAMLDEPVSAFIDAFDTVRPMGLYGDLREV